MRSFLALVRPLSFSSVSLIRCACKKQKQIPVRWSGLGQSDALNFQADFRGIQQRVVNQALMNGFFDASFVIIAELLRNLHRNAKVLQAWRSLSLFGGDANACTFG